jgi:hypothetical protein
LNQTDDSKAHYTQLPQRYHWLSGIYSDPHQRCLIRQAIFDPENFHGNKPISDLDRPLLEVCTRELLRPQRINKTTTYYKVFELLKFKAISILKPEYITTN